MEQPPLIKTFWVIAPESIIKRVSGQLAEYTDGWYPCDAFLDEHGKWWFDWFETKEAAVQKANRYLTIELNELEAEYQERKKALLMRKERLGMQ